MRTPLALLVAAALAIGAPAPAGARGVPAQATTTTATAAVSGSTVTLTITVAADSEPVPEGTVTVTEGDTDLGTLPLEGGTATWSGTASEGIHTYDVAYTPADSRWLASAAEPVSLSVGKPPTYLTCDPPYSVSVGLRPDKRSTRSTIVVRLRTRGNALRYSGWMRIAVTGPGRLDKQVRLDFERARRIVAPGPDLRRAGIYRVRATAHPDGCPVRSGQVRIVVKKKHR